MAEDLQSKKMDYSFKNENFAIDGELMVNITLGEYRELVTSKATRDMAIKEAEQNKWKRDEENSRLLKENASLKAELYELKKKFDERAENGKVSVDYEDDAANDQKLGDE